MNTDYYFLLPENEFPDAVIHAPFEDQYHVWKHLRSEITDRANHALFTSHFIPLLMPVIRPFLYRVPPMDREDFMQDLSLAFFRRLPEYDPDYGGEQLLGNVFFRYVAHGVYRNYAKKEKRASCVLHMEDITGIGEMLPASTPSAEDMALARIDGDRMAERYRKAKEHYKSRYAAIYRALAE